MKNNFIIYGSYGYTGNLIAQSCLRQGLRPVLAGRNEEKLKHQAKELNLEYQVIDLDNFKQTKNILKEFMAVINCAGPFKYTFKNMALACIATKTHYLDITGEVMVIDQLMAMNEEAKTAGVMIMPGSGFDVVPSDCLSSYLKNCLPDATKLVLAIGSFNNDSNFSISQGTAKTMMEDIAEGTKIRDQGKIKTAPLCWKTRVFNFENGKERLCALVSWGDIASAWWSTKIPHIETYMALPKGVIWISKLINPFKRIFNFSLIKRFITSKINQLPAGPSDEDRHNSVVKIYGEVSNDRGMAVTAIMTTPNGYDFTVLSIIKIMKEILAGNAPIGFQTPSSAYTEDFVMNIPGVFRSPCRK